MTAPDATTTLDFALVRLTGIIDKLVIYPANMKRNLERLGGLVHSQRVMIALTQKGVAREDAYRLGHRQALRVSPGAGEIFALLHAARGLLAQLRETPRAAAFHMHH